MVKGCQKDFTTREQRQLINATLHVAPLSLFEPLFPEVAVWLSWKERELPAFNWLWTLNIKKNPTPCSSQQDSPLKID